MRLCGVAGHFQGLSRVSTCDLDVLIEDRADPVHRCCEPRRLSRR